MAEPPAPPERHSPGLRAPVSAALAAQLRRAVLDHAVAEPRRVYPPVLHVGVPGRQVWTHPVAPLAGTEHVSDDHTLRTDVVAAMLARARSVEHRPLVWLTRPGPLHLQDVDAAWLAAAWAACAEAGVELTMVVVNRTGWRDPRTGTGQVWAKIRRVPR